MQSGRVRRTGVNVDGDASGGGDAELTGCISCELLCTRKQLERPNLQKHSILS